ncbi:rhamnogalacturonate lyase C [Trichophyton mentagrophytes]|uniref:Calcineurin-like phosphoesterase domain-containing protein n=1 Tax=Trichophyton interdigitale (strain MR816) TaxID=1215338 RepID=A0A059J522_TRIIM|nr:hypothetical protein H101_06369 [Trichophyton interdigitale H6]KDB22577.1 hypothetical protein H109_05498 [Trichophyton interdigitale MR816]GBF59694.1 rhamnogalacturonate lyase C [Trichophyton mentagrophytes]
MVKTRFVCVSDTHGYGTREAAFRLPKGDVLIHAGDITNKGTVEEFRNSAQWIREADFEVKIVIAGNHDAPLDKELYKGHTKFFHGKKVVNSDECLDLISAGGITYLDHTSKTIRLKRKNGPKTMFKVFGSARHPTNAFGWNSPFGYPANSPDDARKWWSQIPSDADVVVTHTPAKNHLDLTTHHGNIGCEYLRQALWSVRPRLSICGHVHEARGYERVIWDVDDTKPGTFGEISTTVGTLPPRESKKMSRVDLTGKTYPRLANEGPKDPARSETCFINAAILATHYPHAGGRKFNAPIVIDIDLPLDDEQEPDQN